MYKNIAIAGKACLYPIADINCLLYTSDAAD